jgi:DNA-binding NarL/FixJ family response regulator
MRVALVDDDDHIRELVAVHLLLDGRFELIAEAADGNAALALLDRQDIDVMVLDMHMPVVSGRQVLVEARIRRPDMRIIVFSADLTILSEVAGSGATATVAKGDSLELLVAAVAGDAAA